MTDDPRDTAYEHCPAPRIDAAIPLTEETLLALLRQNPNSSGSPTVDLRWALANLYLANGRFGEAVAAYQMVLAGAPELAAARCNLGVCYFALNQHELAIPELSQALLQNPAQALAPLYLARAHEAQGAYDAARQWYLKARDLDPGSSSALAGLAALYEARGDQTAANELYIELRTLEPDHLRSEVKLGEVFFLRGKSAFARGDLDEAFSDWGEGFRRYPRAFNSEQGIANDLRKLAREFREQKLLAGARRRFLSLFGEGVVRDKVLESKESYALFSKLYFELGLLPEFFERRDELGERAEWWRKECERGGVYPYAHVRLGIIHTLQGNLDEALEAFTFAQDHMPAGKSRPLKLTQILRFVRDLNKGRAVRDRASSDASIDVWAAAGFTDPFGQEAWKKTGLEPGDAAAWRTAGFTAQQTLKWLDEDLVLEQAVSWGEHGFSEPIQVGRWIRGEFSPAEAKMWTEDFEEGLARALQCKQAGFPDAKTARAWLAIFSVPYAAAPWYQLGFTPEEAARWCKEGITDPFAAKQQKDADEAIFREAAGAEEPD